MVSLTAQKTNLIFSESEGDRILDIVDARTCCACKMRIDDFLSIRIQVHKHPKYKLSSCDRVPLGAYKEIQRLNMRAEANYMWLFIGNHEWLLLTSKYTRIYRNWCYTCIYTCLPRACGAREVTVTHSVWVWVLSQVTLQDKLTSSFVVLSRTFQGQNDLTFLTRYFKPGIEINKFEFAEKS